jgi:uncharacterized protein YegL
MPTLNDFVMQKPRPLPVIVAVDRSGSMGADGKIDALNIALRDFINSIKDEDTAVDLQVALFSFGGNEAVCELPLTSVNSIDADAYSFTAQGRTPMGQAFYLIKEMIEDKSIIPSRAYKPTIVLLTDGMPTDDYEKVMDYLINEGRSSKAFRIAMAIGADADRNMLSKFVSSPELLVEGENARDIKKFFRFVTMSVTSRMKSQTPDTPPAVQFSDDEIVL